MPDVSSLRNMLRRRRMQSQAVNSSSDAHKLPGTFDAALFQIAIRRSEPGTVVLPAHGSKPRPTVVTLAGDAMVSAHYRLGETPSNDRRFWKVAFLVPLFFFCAAWNLI